MDKARFHHLVMNKSKQDLQSDMLKLGNAAYLLAQDSARTDDNGDLLPPDKQTDKQVREIFEITCA